MKENGTLSWNLKALSDALKISLTDTQEYFTDGRRISFIMERRIAYEVLHGTLAKSEGDGWDVIDQAGGHWEVRSISDSGVYFCPSYMIGSGRSFNEVGFIKKLNEIQGYYLSDITRFPNVPYWKLDKNIVLNWYENKKLGSSTKISRLKVLEYLKNI
jgi:hypothetical protein